VNQLPGKIKAQAVSLGLTKVGIARAERLEPESGRLTGWLERGFQGTMAWMSRNADKRSDPRLILPGAKSVIVVALNYYTDVRHSDDERTAKISRYAWGDDYHEVLQSKLNRLLEFVKKEAPGCSGKVYVDTGPVMEKAWAQRAGIGWQGKHTNLITQEHGSWVFLGEIIVDIDLTPDEPATDHCGSCTLCLEACPTQALVEPYVLDSTRCISYLTIEHRGAIAERLGEKFDRWVYGCDICQDVCPWNIRFSQPTSLQEFFPREHNIAPRIRELTELTQEDFNSKYKKSPMRRTKLSGIVRNAKILFTTIFETKES
jgi:epoxyqueuosine reductase